MRYEHKTLRYGPGHRKVRRLLADGWEVVTTKGGTSILSGAPTTVLRRPVGEAPKKRSLFDRLVFGKPS